jgi:hypothetical protein
MDCTDVIYVKMCLTGLHRCYIGEGVLDWTAHRCYICEDVLDWTAQCYISEGVLDWTAQMLYR